MPGGTWKILSCNEPTNLATLWNGWKMKLKRENAQDHKVNACRLLKSAPAIAGRIRELQAEAAKAKQTTVETVVDELEAARVIAERNEQPSAMVSASMGKARILGLEAPHKSEIGRPGDFSGVESMAELVDKICKTLAQETSQIACGIWLGRNSIVTWQLSPLLLRVTRCRDISLSMLIRTYLL